jgi:small subunit ribosomal protein S1
MSDNLTDEKKGNGVKNFADAVGSYFQDENRGKIESFADLLDSYDSGMNEDIQIGDRIKGEIISIGKDTVFVNTGTKIDGAVDKGELLDKEGNLSYNVGDVLELYVVSFNENEIRLSKAISGNAGLSMLRDAFESRIPVEGKITEQCKGGFHVEIMQRTAFCPISQMDLRYVEKPEEYVGKECEFLITQLEGNARNIVVSRRILLEKEQEEAKKNFMSEVSEGAVLEGKVSSLTAYGAFVELFPSIEGMVHVSEISWSRVEKPEEVLKIGEPVTVKVIGIEPGKKKSQLKISLSMKQVSGNPWESGEELFRAGEKVQGKVTRCTDFGAFVEIAPGIEGLVHISEMSYKKRVVRSEDVVQAGDLVDVLIKDVDMENKRISLSIRDAEGDPWIGVEKKYTIGQAVTGTVEKKEKFGYFVTLEPGITGLFPKSKIKKSAQSSAIEKLKVGDAITVEVEEIHPRSRKITLGPGDEKDEDNWQKYSADKHASLGSLGEKLQAALKAKK